MLEVGIFLNSILKDHARHSIMESPCLPSNRAGEFSQPLYSCHTYTQMDLICLILSIFSRIPNTYEILHCKVSTTDEELGLFLKRVEKYCAQYLMLDVNKLSLKLQEVCIGEEGSMSL